MPTCMRSINCALSSKSSLIGWIEKSLKKFPQEELVKIRYTKAVTFGNILVGKFLRIFLMSYYNITKYWLLPRFSLAAYGTNPHTHIYVGICARKPSFHPMHSHGYNHSMDHRTFRNLEHETLFYLA